MISFSIVIFLPLTFLLLRSLSAVSNSLYLSVFYSSSILSRSLLMQSSIAISVFLASISPPLSGHLLSLPVFHLPFFLHDQPMYSSPISPENFPSLQHPLSFLPLSIISSLNSHEYSYQVDFRKPGPSPLVYLLVPSHLKPMPG